MSGLKAYYDYAILGSRGDFGEERPTALYVYYPHWKAALRNFGWMLPSVPISPVYNFFRQNIWHLIYDQFHFHHIFGDDTTVSSDKTAEALVVLLLVLDMPFFASWMAIRERSLKYLEAQQVSQQISIFSNLNFTMKGASVKKAILSFFSSNDPICHCQKFQP